MKNAIVVHEKTKERYVFVKHIVAVSETSPISHGGFCSTITLDSGDDIYCIENHKVLAEEINKKLTELHENKDC